MGFLMVVAGGSWLSFKKFISFFFCVGELGSLIKSIKFGFPQNEKNLHKIWK
jgi:hypothetical protein